MRHEHAGHPFDGFLFAGRRGGGGRDGGGGRFGGGGPGNPFGGNPFGGHPFHAFFRRGGRARRGDVRAAILVLLAEQSRNGYQLMQEIETRSEGAWRPSPGAMYPALQQLEDEGLVQVSADASGRVFSLTTAGKKQAEAAKKEPAPWEAAIGPDREATVEFHQLIKQVTLAAMQVAQAGGDAQLTEARKILKDARKALYRLLAEDDADDE